MARPVLRNRRGFTLIELLVALVLSGIITGVIFQFLLDQTRFARFQTAREEVQQNARAALELISSDLRGIPPLGLEVARENSITFRSPRLWGVVCDVPASTTVHVALPADLGISYSAGSSNTHPELVAETTGNEGAQRQWTAPQTVTAISQIPSSTCDGTALQPNTEMRSFTVGSSANFTVGNLVYLSDRITYRTGTSAGLPDTWIHRRLGADVVPSQPLAGPIPGNDGLRFRYFRADGTALPFSSGEISAANRELVTRIELTVDAISSGEIAGSRQSRLERLSVVLRNRP